MSKQVLFQLNLVLNVPPADFLVRILQQCSFAKGGYFYLVNEDLNERYELGFSLPDADLVRELETKDRISYRTTARGRALVFKITPTSLAWIRQHISKIYPECELAAQNLTFLRKSGSVWFHSVTHEDEFWFYFSKSEIDAIKKTFDGTFPFEVKQITNLPDLEERLRRDIRTRRGIEGDP